MTSYSKNELLPRRPSSYKGYSKDELTTLSINIKPSKSVGYLEQMNKTVQRPKWDDIPKIKICKNEKRSKKLKDDNKCCPTCGQPWPSDTERLQTDTVLEQNVSKQDDGALEDITSRNVQTLSLPSRKKIQISGINRSSSLGHKGKLSNQTQNTSRTSRVIKAASMMDTPIHNIYKPPNDRFGRAGSKESSRSSASLIRRLSLNFDTCRIIRGDTRLDGCYSNSLKTNKSSVKSIMSYENEIDSEYTAECSGTDYDDLINYSPKITVDTKYVNGCPLDGFKTLFDEDSFRIPSIYGQLKIMFQFFNDTNELQVTVLEGSNVAVGNLKGKTAIYCKICLMPGKVQKKTGCNKHSTCNPIFYESFIFKMSLTRLLDRQVKIKLFNKPSVLSAPEPVGQCIVPLYNYDLTAVNVIWQNLQKCKGQKDEMDEFDFSFFERDKDVSERKFGKFLCGYHGKDD